MDIKIEEIVELVELAIKGDEDAFESIYQMYHQKIKFVAYQMYRNNEIANDITQEVFIRVFKKIKDLKDPMAFPKWIYRITYNACFSYNRSKIKFTDLGDEKTIEDFSDHKQQDVTALMDEQGIIDEIKVSFELLSSPLKAVGIMRYFDEMSVEEIAYVLEIPEGTVKSRLSRVRQVVKADLVKRNITPKNYGILFVPGGFFSICLNQLYSEYNEAVLHYGDVSYDAIKNSIEGLSLIGVLASLANHKVLIGFLAASVIALGIFGYNSSDNQEEQVQEQENVIEKPQVVADEVYAAITNINYEKNWTNKSIVLTVETSNDNYDEIQIDGINTLSIDHNGNYKVQLIKDKKTIDEVDISITNIDRESPTGYGVHNENYCNIIVEDDLSQVNENTIVVNRDGLPFYDFYYDVSNNSINFNCKQNEYFELYVSDYAGNELKVITY